MTTKISRHLTSKRHEDHPDILRLPPISATGSERAKRRLELDRLRNLGSFYNNLAALRDNDGRRTLMVGKRSLGEKHPASDYIPCRYCLVFYVKSKLFCCCPAILF